MDKSVFAIASSQDHADRIVTKLQQSGFSSSDISVLLSDSEGKLSVEENETFFNGKRENFSGKKKGSIGHEKHTKAPEGGVTGATAGGIIGGSLGLLAGIGSLAIPGLGVFIAAGPIVAALSGSAIGGAVGLLLGTLVGLGIPEYEAKKYESSLKSGGVLLSVHARDSKRIELAKSILTKEGAKDISVTREKAGFA